MKKRLCLTLPASMAADTAAMKQQLFNHQSNAEMYRQLIRFGLDTLKSTNSSPKETASCATIEN